MKKLLIAASFVGIAGAGTILYVRKKLKNGGREEGKSIDAASKPSNFLTEEGHPAIRPAQHAMG